MFWPNFKDLKVDMLGETLKRKACSFVLENYGHDWLKEKEFNLDQLTLDLYNGKVQFHNLELDASSLNKELSCYNLPFEVVDCFIGCFDIHVPWSSIFTESSEIEIQNLEITLRHCIKNQNKDSFLMPSSLKSSVRLAEECLENDKANEHELKNVPNYESLQELACVFEAIFTRTRATIVGATVCFEHIHEKYTTIFELKIEKMEYLYGEQEKDINQNQKKGFSQEKMNSVRVKNVVFQGVKLYVGINGELNKSDKKRKRDVERVLLVDFVGTQKVKVTTQKEDKDSIATKMSIEPHIEGVNVILCPQIIRYLYKVFCEPPTSNPEGSHAVGKMSSYDVLKSTDKEMFFSCDSEALWARQNHQNPLKAKQESLLSTELSLKISFFSLAVLHADKLEDGDGTSFEAKPCGRWHDNLRDLEENYLNVIRGMPQNKVMNSSELEELRDSYAEMMHRSHFSLMVKQTELKIASDYSKESPLDIDLTLGLVDLSEVIVQDVRNIEYCKWLSFKEGLLGETDEGSIFIIEPSIKLKVCSLQMVIDRSLSPAQLLVSLTLSKCSSELDVTVLNRIQNIKAAFMPVTNKQPAVEVGQMIFEKVHLTFECSHWVPSFRFPKVGPTEGLELKRRFHNEFLLVEFQDFNLGVGINLLLNEVDSLEFHFLSARGNLVDGDEIIRLLTIKCQNLQSESPDWSRIKIELNHGPGVSPNCKTSSRKWDDYSLVELDLQQTSNAPFSSRKRTFNGRQLVEPADRQEMTSYLEEDNDQSDISITVDLQQVVVYLPNKNDFHLLQNRLINDLLLWKLSTMDVTFDSKSSFPSHAEGFPSAFSKKEPAEENDNVSEQIRASAKRGSTVSVNLKMNRLNLLQDTLTSKTFVLALSNFNVAYIPRYQENDESWYLSIQSEAVELRMTTKIKDNSIWPSDGNAVTKLVQVSKDSFGLEEMKSTKDALSITLLARKTSETSTHFKVACSLRNCILHYTETPKGEQWWPIQLADVFSGITGGNAETKGPLNSNRAPSCTSEVHISLKNCAAEYKPPLLSYHMVLMAESAHFAQTTDLVSGCQELSLYVEDAGLFLAGKQQGSRKIDLRRDFVCVADINSLELTKKQTDKFVEKCPQMKVTASVNRFNIRTCSDSFAALSQIIIQLANNSKAEQTDEDSMATVRVEDAVREMTVENEDKMLELLHEASNEVVRSSSVLVNNNGHVGQLFGGNRADERPIINTQDVSYTMYGDSFSIRLSPDVDQIHCSSPRFPQTFRSSSCLRSPIGMSTLEPNPSSTSTPKNGRNSDEKLLFVEDHYKKPARDSCVFEGNDQPIPVSKYHLHDTSITWFMYGGKDFIRGGREQPKSGSRSEKHQQMGTPWNRFCGLGRNKLVLMEFRINKIQALHELYPEGLSQLSRDVLFIKEFEVIDRLEISDINKFLHPYSNERLRPSDPNMFRISARYSRDESNMSKNECTLKISLMPFKLNIDQHSLTFMCEFLNEVAEQVNLPSQLPQKRSGDGKDLGGVSPKNRSNEYEQIYFRSVKFSPEVIIKIDYRGKMVDKGSVVGFLTSILQVNQSRVVLRRINSRRGMKGFDKVGTFLIDEWINDIKTNQIPSLVKSIAPMGTLINIAQGVKNLFFMPVEQYKKDGRVVMGLQKGAYSFATCTLVSSLDLVYNSFQLIQSISQFAHDVVASGEDNFQTRDIYKRAKHPEDLREGFAGACAIFKEGLNIRATEMKEVVSKEHHQKGMAGTIGGILRQVPQTVIDPILLASKATTKVIEGARNQILPGMKKEEMEKWKTRQ